MRPLTANPSEAIEGRAPVPGDKSISHRALMIAALATGESTIEGLLEGEDVLRTAAAMQALGAEVERDSGGTWHVWGRGIGGLIEPDQVLDMGNSGTGARLLLGILASHPLTAILTGDASLRGRPMARVAAPLREMGAQFLARDGCRLPLTVIGTGDATPISYKLPVASAQVKSAVLFAGLNAPGATSVIEPVPTRDHTERMLRTFGANIDIAQGNEGRISTLQGQPELIGQSLRVPGDPSSAAFPLVAAAILPGSRLSLEAVGMNPHRTGLIDTLKEMGAQIEIRNPREEAGEPVADLSIEAAPLIGVEVPAWRAPSMIDEYPILAIAAACARGVTVMHGLAELRVKESDRLSAMARGLAACGVELEEGPDSLTVHGKEGRVPGGAVVETALDHRIAMSFLVLGLNAERPVTVDDTGPIETSFPGFAELMAKLGAKFTTP